MPAIGCNPGDPANTQFATTAAGNGTLTVAQIFGALFVTLASSGATAWTTPTAAQIIAAAPYAIPVPPNQPFSYVLRVYNTNGGTLTLTGGTGVTITGTATIATNVFRDYLVSITSATTVVLQNIGAGNAT